MCSLTTECVLLLQNVLPNAQQRVLLGERERERSSERETEGRRDGGMEGRSVCKWERKSAREGESACEGERARASERARERERESEKREREARAGEQLYWETKATVTSSSQPRDQPPVCRPTPHSSYTRGYLSHKVSAHDYLSQSNCIYIAHNSRCTQTRPRRHMSRTHP